jgi:uncharacterized protein (TIGR02301 family)
MMPRLPVLVLSAILAAGAPPEASAQQRGAAPAAPAARNAPTTPAAKPPDAPAAQPEPPPPPYEKELLRLSEILGSLAFLRKLCAASDAAEWPKRMQALIESEGTTPGRRARLAGAYNRGYQSFALTYRTCTASAAEAVVRYLNEGEQLAHNLVGSYGS